MAKCTAELCGVNAVTDVLSERGGLFVRGGGYVLTALAIINIERVEECSAAFFVLMAYMRQLLSVCCSTTDYNCAKILLRVSQQS